MLERNAGQIAQEREAPATFLSAFLNRVWSQLRTRSKGRHLRLCETLSLGEKRFLAVVEYDREKISCRRNAAKHFVVAMPRGSFERVPGERSAGSEPGMTRTVPTVFLIGVCAVLLLAFFRSARR